MPRSRIAVMLLGAALVASACQDAPITSPGTEGTSLALNQGALQAGESVQDRLARTVPGFGGFFLDDNDQPTAFITDDVNRGEAMRALNDELRALGLSRGDVRVLPASYRWTELTRWHDQGTAAALAIDGVAWTDADEASNRVRIGVSNLASMGQVRTELAALGIPAGAVALEPTEPIQNMATLRDQIRPTVGGIQINWPGFLCTLGFNATSGGVASFITNSHCSGTQGGVQNTPYWQPLQSTSPTQIAVEVDDPNYTSGGACPAGKVCRRSDASRARYINSTATQLGRIARTASAKNGGLEIVGQWTITAADDLTDNFVIGTTVNKVGRTTGWSAGRVTYTCVNTGVSGTDIVQFCQTFFRAKINGGDSGSPAFTISGGTNVTLVGIVWGGGSGQIVFSPLKNIESELGNLVVF